MRVYLARRIIQAIVVVFVMVTLMFVIFRIIPSDPTAMHVERGMPEATRQQLLEQWGLTGPLYVQFVRYLANLFQGDFGLSFFYSKPVWEILAPKVLNTLWIAVPGLLLGATVGALLGMFVGWSRRGGMIERLGILSATVIRGAPSFVIGILALMVFSGIFDLLPGFGMRTPGANPSGFAATYLNADFFLHLILPVAVIALTFIPENLLLMRTGVLEARGEDYLEMVRAKGVSEFRVMWHAGRNSLLPVITWLFPSLAETVAGVVLVEVVFSWPGVGRELVFSVTRQDMPIAQAGFLLLAVMIVTSNLLADLVYGYLDPRVVYK
ncbi:MAG: ABC transporter permease [Burkholderiales bacterium]|nr:ABC transporter permease [Burkholderiales bacterium]